MASEEHADDCCPNYVPMNMAKSAHNYCVAENKRLLEENALLKAEVERLSKVMDVAGPMLFDAYMQLANAYAAKEGKQE